MPFIDNELYSDDALSDGLGGSPAPATLAKWRVSGDGPKFVRVGRTPRYRGSDINAWLASRTVSQTSAPEFEQLPLPFDLCPRCQHPAATTDYNAETDMFVCAKCGATWRRAVDDESRP
jgi:hypothetical protein